MIFHGIFTHIYCLLGFHGPHKCSDFLTEEYDGICNVSRDIEWRFALGHTSFTDFILMCNVPF